MRRMVVIGLVLLGGCGGGTTATTVSTPPVTLAPPSESTTTVPTSTTTSGASSSTTATTVSSTPETSVDAAPPDVTPIITFEERILTFVRELRVPLWADADPDVDISYVLVDGHPDSVGQENCLIEGSEFVFITEPDSPPVPARCAVEASAPGTDAEPVVTIVEVGFANRVASIDPIGVVSHAETGGTIDVTVFEDSGSTYTMTYTWFCDGAFEEGNASPDPAPPGTTEFTFTITFGPTGGQCDISGQAEPLDQGGGTGFFETSFEVVP